MDCSALNLPKVSEMTDRCNEMLQIGFIGLCFDSDVCIVKYAHEESNIYLIR